MPEPVSISEADASTPPDRSRRAVVIATVGIVVILGVAFLIAAFVVPFLRTRALVGGCYVAHLEAGARSDLYPPPGLFRSRSQFPHGGDTLEHLGGRRRAFQKLRTYLRMPDWAAPNKPAALWLIGEYGPQAVPMLTEALADPDPIMRRVAAWQLGEIGVDANAAVPALEKALKDKDEAVYSFAVEALAKIRASEEPEE